MRNLIPPLLAGPLGENICQPRYSTTTYPIFRRPMPAVVTSDIYTPNGAGHNNPHVTPNPNEEGQEEIVASYHVTPIIPRKRKVVLSISGNTPPLRRPISSRVEKETSKTPDNHFNNFIIIL